MIQLFLVFKSNNDSHTISFPSKKSRKIDFFYSSVDIILVAEVGVDATLFWGIEGSEVELNFVDNSVSEGFSQISSLKSEFSITEESIFWHKNLEDKSFVSHLMHGDFPLSVLIDDKKHWIGRLLRNNIIGAPVKGTYRYYENIIKYVFKSGRSLLFNEIFSRKSDAILSTVDYGENQSFTLVIQFANSLVKILEKLESNLFVLPSTLIQKRAVVDYAENVEIDLDSIMVFVTDPSAWAISAPGSVSFGGIQPRVIETPSYENTYDLTDNRMLLDFLMQLRRDIATFVDRLEVNATYLRGLIQKLDHYRHFLEHRLGISFNAGATQSIPFKYLNSQVPEILEMGDLIQRWKKLGKEDVNSDNYKYHFSVYTTEKLWEFFCFEKIVKVCTQIGFAENFCSPDYVVLTKDTTTIYIYYDRETSPGGMVRDVTNYSSRGVAPDFLIIVDSPSGQIVGVLDAKYTPNESDWRSRGSEIWSKYGLWIRKGNGEVIDFVYSLVPSTSAGMLKSEMYGEDIAQLNLGTLPLLMDEHDNSGEAAISKLLQL